MDQLDRQDKEFKILGIKQLFRGPLILTLLALAVAYIVYQHNKMLELTEDSRTREMAMQERLYERVIQNISPDLNAINQNIQIATQKIDSVNQFKHRNNEKSPKL